jgi:hypothetical protein
MAVLVVAVELPQVQDKLQLLGMETRLAHRQAKATTAALDTTLGMVPVAVAVAAHRLLVGLRLTLQLLGLAALELQHLFLAPLSLMLVVEAEEALMFRAHLEPEVRVAQAVVAQGLMALEPLQPELPILVVAVAVMPEI